MVAQRYRRHWSLRAIAKEAIATMACAVTLFWATWRLFDAMLKGRTEVPLKSLSFTATSEEVGWFLLALLIWSLFCALSAGLMLLFCQRLRDELKR